MPLRFLVTLEGISLQLRAPAQVKAHLPLGRAWTQGRRDAALSARTALGAAGGRGGLDGSTRRPPLTRRQGNLLPKPRSRGGDGGGAAGRDRGQSPSPTPFPRGRGVPGPPQAPWGRGGGEVRNISACLGPFPRPSAPLPGKSQRLTQLSSSDLGSSGAHAPPLRATSPNPAPPRSSETH